MCRRRKEMGQTLTIQPHVPRFPCLVASWPGWIWMPGKWDTPSSQRVWSDTVVAGCPRFISVASGNRAPAGSILVALMPSPVRRRWLRPPEPGLTGSGRQGHGPPHATPQVGSHLRLQRGDGFAKRASVSLWLGSSRGFLGSLLIPCPSGMRLTLCPRLFLHLWREACDLSPRNCR